MAKLKKLTPTPSAISNTQNDEIVFSFKGLKRYSYDRHRMTAFFSFATLNDYPRFRPKHGPQPIPPANLGHRIGNVFNVIFIEHEFGDVYNHGK